MSSVEDARFAPSVVVQALDMIQSAVGHTPRSSRYCSGAPQLINKEVAKSSLKAHPRRCFSCIDGRPHVPGRREPIQIILSVVSAKRVN
jgi:hypothetical protein